MGPVAHHHVAGLVGDHTRELRFIVRRLNGAAIHIDETTGQCEGIDVSSVHHFELLGIVSREGLVLGEPASQVVEVAKRFEII